MDAPCTDRNAILNQLQAVLSSRSFSRAQRSTAMLRFIVRQTVDGHAERLTEFTLGSDALGRGASFDPATDPLVREVATRLRRRLKRYYEAPGCDDPVLIDIPKGSYVPRFTLRATRNEAKKADRVVIPHLRSQVHRIRRSLVGWLCAAVVGALLAAAFLPGRGAPPADRPLEQFEVELKSDGQLATDVGTTTVVSSDGTRLVYVTRNAEGRTHLNWRRLTDIEPVPLPGTDGARGPFLSPDGQWVGFWANGKLRKTPLQGGATIDICDADELFGASWGEGNTIVASLGESGRLWRIPAVGGAPELAIDLSRESTVVRWPQLLPGGDNVIYTAIKGNDLDNATIEVQSINGRNRKVLAHGATFGRYLGDGYLTYIDHGTLYAVPFDLKTLTTQKTPIPVVDDVSYSPQGYAQVDLSGTGTIVFLRGGESDRSVVDWIDRSGKRVPLVTQPGRYSWLRLSPDGDRLAVTIAETTNASVAVFDMRTGEEVRVSRRPGTFAGVTWLPNRSLVVGGSTGLTWVRSILPADSAPLMLGDSIQIPWSVAPDGRQIAYYQQASGTGFDLWTAPILDSTSGVTLGVPQSVLQTPAVEMYPSFSPDGAWMAYSSNASGTSEIYVRRFPMANGDVRVSMAGGVVPRWSPNGHELLYQTETHRVMVATYKVDGNAFVADPPKLWSDLPLAGTGNEPSFDVSADGERVIALMAVQRQTANHATFMVNFVDEVRRRIAAQ